nr:hypothetical transcript [Hymenolepis microstoma]
MSAMDTTTQSDVSEVVPYQEITNPTPVVTRMSLAEMNSFTSHFIGRISDEFTQQVTDLLIEEIGELRRVILSEASQHTGVKRKAWEEVASNLALRYPCEQKRCGIQLKKKWENIVGKMITTFRADLLKKAMKDNKSLSMAVRFIAEASRAKRRAEESQRTASGTNEKMSMEYSDNLPNSSLFGSETVADTQGVVKAVTNASNIDNRIQSPQVVRIKKEENETPPSSTSIASNAGTHTATKSTDVNSEEESDDDSSDTEDSTVPIVLPNANGCPGGCSAGDESNLTERRKRKKLNRELTRQSRAEHERRIKILDIKHRYWKLKLNSLERKMAQEEQQQ